MNETRRPTGEIGKDKVLKIIGSVIDKLGQQNDVSQKSLMQELNGLQELIISMRRDIASARTEDITEKHIPVATDELDAVINSTAEATGSIMDACEAIESCLVNLDNSAISQNIIQEITKIYEACSFQDITGQRIRKVVDTLKAIELKVNALVGLIHHDNNVLAHEYNVEETGRDSLLNGPQLPQNAITQADIDKLLEEFG